MRGELGDFFYDEEPNNHGQQVELRDQAILENQALYEGEWIVGTDIRCGRGK